MALFLPILDSIALNYIYGATQSDFINAKNHEIIP